MDNGTLVIQVAFHGPMDVRKENRRAAPWGLRIVTLLPIDDITQEESSDVVTKLRTANPGMVFRARWTGPVAL